MTLGRGETEKEAGPREAASPPQASTRTGWSLTGTIRRPRENGWVMNCPGEVPDSRSRVRNAKCQEAEGE